MPEPRPLHAKRMRIEPRLIQQHEIEAGRVTALVEHLRRGGELPPVVVAMYANGAALPLDGHHRMLAHHQLGREVDAWVISGKSFDRLCMLSSDAEALVLCNGVPAMQVAK